MSKNHKLISLNLQKCHGGGDDNEGEFVVDKNDFQKKDIARRRWGLLAKALKSPISSQPSSPTDEISMRRFSTFELLRTELLRVENVTDCEYINELSPTKPLTFKKRYWYRYYTDLNSIYYFIDIGHVSRSLTAADLIGFNNTGNVCVWPSEEALAFYILNNIPKFRGRNVLELGAGMSALAGIIVAKYGQAKRVYLTDGNAIAVDNVRVTLERNQFSCDVKSDVLQWDQNYTETFDVILTADCLFFDEARTDLINTIWNCLTLEGVAYVMAPKRGETLDIFINKAELKGFRCEKCLIYNDVVWSRHLECLDNPDYNENLHYPVLLLLKKSADYWKSQAKKYCEFCKCWIADNRPSVEFHEKGRKHKENVARKLRTITKQSHRDQRESARMDTALKRMERAAMEAYRKDIEANADISSRAINETLEQQNLTLSSKNIWHEVNKDGVTLYKNTETNESVKTPPSCGYLSLAEQQASVFATGKKQLQKLEKFRNTQDSLKAEDEKKQQEEDRAAAQREKMKALRVVEPEPEPVVVSGPILEQRTGIYAPWKAVEQRPKTQLNLQLPKQEEYVAAITLPVEKPETKKNFKEKTVTSLEPEVSQDGGESSGVEFKKRKFIGNKNRNTRQRLDND